MARDSGGQCPFAREIERGAGWRVNRLFEKRVKAGASGNLTPPGGHSEAIRVEAAGIRSCA